MEQTIKRFLKGSKRKPIKKTSGKKKNIVTDIDRKRIWGKVYDTRKYNGYLQYKKKGKWVFSHRERCLNKYKLDKIPKGFAGELSEEFEELKND